MRRFRVYSIRSCFVLTVLASIVLLPASKAYRQSQAVQTVRRFGEVYYDYQVGDRGWSTTVKPTMPYLTSMLGPDVIYDVAGVGFYSEVPEDTWEALRRFPELRVLSCEFQEHFTDRHLRRLPTRELRMLVLSYTAIGDAGLEALENCHRLQRLYLCSTRISDRGLSSLSKLKSLQELSLEDTSMGDQGLTALGVLPNLRRLNLRGTRVTNEGLASLPQFPQLEVLQLVGTDVGAEGLPRLSQCGKLRAVSIYDEQVTTEAADAFAKRFPQIQLHVGQRSLE